MKSLQKESFNTDTDTDNEKKQIGFYSDNPLLWYKALQECTMMNNMINRCELKKNKNDKITICKIYVCFGSVKQVMISTNGRNITQRNFVHWMNRD